MTADLSEIIERVEGATGPDREIDALIAEANGWVLAGIPPWTMGWFGPDGEEMRRGPLAYTSSLDDALTLVPEGWAVRDLNIWPGFRPYVSLWGTHEDGGERWHNGKYGRVRAEAATPALALCAAALRARLATQEQQG